MFIVKTGIRREGHIRLVFVQDIFRLPDNKLIVRAKITGAATQKGRPVRPDQIVSLLNL